MRPVALKDLAYELQLLMGADDIVSFIEAHDSESTSDADRFGNLVNYFKDSVYLHSRNLLNALTNEYPTEIGTVPAATRSQLYGRVKGPLERYVSHINQARDQRGESNLTSDGGDLNEYTHDLTSEAQRCWSEWIEATHQRELQQHLDTAIKSAQNDCTKLQKLMKG
jgi:hypothetical protein